MNLNVKITVIVFRNGCLHTDNCQVLHNTLVLWNIVDLSFDCLNNSALYTNLVSLKDCTRRANVYNDKVYKSKNHFSHSDESVIYVFYYWCV